jgi:hypothetical protein
LELTHGGLPWRFWPSPLPKSSMTGWRMGYVLRFETPDGQKPKEFRP